MSMPFKLFFLIFIINLGACQAQKSNTSATKNKEIQTWPLEFPEEFVSIEKTDQEWKTALTPLEFYVLREKGTERSFSGPFVKNKKVGVYTCGGCGLPLFDSATKFKSGTGWPSYFKPIKETYIKEDVDYDIGYKRTEITCARCDGHLGHVFPDGPKPTGLRYCINGASLDFVEKKD